LPGILEVGRGGLTLHRLEIASKDLSLNMLEQICDLIKISLGHHQTRNLTAGILDSWGER